MTRAILPGTYGCVPTSGPVGWTIKHATASPYSHAFIVLDPATVMEARPSGVGTAHLDKYLRAGAVLNDEEPLDDLFRTQVCTWAGKMVGAPYDWSCIVDLAAQFLGDKSPLLPAGKHGAYICSQLVSVGYTACGKTMFPTTDRWKVSPRLLADRITGRAWETP